MKELVWSAVGLVVLSVCAAAQEDLDAARDRVIPALVELGYAPPEDLKIERLAERLVFDATYAQLDTLIGDRGFETIGQLHLAAGVEQPWRPGEFRRSLADHLKSNLLAYYDFRRKRAVLPISWASQGSEANFGLDGMVVCLLVAACQDRREPDIAGYLSSAPTLDQRLVRQSVLLGEMSTARAVWEYGATAVRETSEGVFTTGTAIIYNQGPLTALPKVAGREWSARIYQEGGLDGLRSSQDRTPSSTEQILHPDKLGIDLPVEVELPEVADGLELRHQDTAGEMAILAMLIDFGIDFRRATLAATGWDGDRLAVHRSENGDDLLLWRSVWDREVDAVQFDEVMRELASAQDAVVARRGRVVDLCVCGVQELRQIGVAALEASQVDAESVATDSETTGLAEALAEQRFSNRSVRDGFWCHRDAGLKVPIPDGWEIQGERALRVLTRADGSRPGEASWIRVFDMPAADIPDLNEVLRRKRASLEKLDEMTVESLSIRKLGGVPVVFAEYRGRYPQGGRPLHCLHALYLRGHRQHEILLIADAVDWPDEEQELRALMNGVEIAPD